jgi:hypothetical protein
MMLRNYMYLDTSALENYLSTLEGFVIQNQEFTSTDYRREDNHIGVPDLSSQTGSSLNASQDRQARSYNEYSLFQRLYNLLEGQSAIAFLDGGDLDAVEKLKKGQVVEIDAQLRISQIFLMSEAVETGEPLAALMALTGQNPLEDPNVKAQFDAARAIGQFTSQQKNPLMFNLTYAKNIKGVAFLTNEFLRVKPSELQNEATIFGRVQRIIPKGQKYEVPLLSPSLLSQIAVQNRAQKRQAKHSNTNNNSSEILRGPALVLEVIAVYK